LGVFNLLPTLPLDGGRAVRGLLWHRTGDYTLATRIASGIGRSIAAILVISGLALLLLSLDPVHSPIPSVLGYDPRMVGLVAILLAWFLNNGARNAYRQVMLQGRFAGISVSQLMTRDPSTVSPWNSLDEIVAQHFLQRGERAVTVVRDQNVLAGLVTYGDVRKVPRSAWTSRAAGEVMTPAARLVTVGPDDNVEVAIRHMAERHFNQLPVVADGHLVGMIARVNILRFIDLKDK
jgi:CBS domain-containing protein